MKAFPPEMECTLVKVMFITKVVGVMRGFLFPLLMPVVWIIVLFSCPGLDDLTCTDEVLYLKHLNL
jgi:hypothetical protein